MALIEEMEKQGNFLFRYRSYLPLFILVGGLGVFYFNRTQYPDNQLDEWYKYVCLADGLFGLLIRIYTVGHTPDNTSGRNTSAGQVADELNQTGIYSAVRHPLYLGNFLMWLSIGMLTESLWFCMAFVFMYWVYYERIMFAEEAFLRNKFKEKYLDWASKVPAFVPSFSSWKSSKYSFSWKKVLKREKNGVFALFTLFFMFEIFENYLKTNEFVLEKSFWFYGFIGSGIFYFIFKALKNTKMMQEKGR
jgi:protein-S-isoprenylcysteine O-methyltransferase Ste14